jgi:glycosyltransferase involved in cell wall biosynthesis
VSSSDATLSTVSEPVATATPPDVDPRLRELRRVAIVPALNEERTVGRIIDELRAFDSGLDVVVVDDGSVDRTAEAARARGARVLCLPFNLGIGGAVQTGFRFAFENDYDIVVRVDGDGQHDPAQLSRVLDPVIRGDADIAVGSRFAGQRVTDTTSGFQALNRQGIELFAHDYPHDYPEVEAMVLLFRHRLRLVEVPVEMRERAGGRSSITALRSVYYMVKVLLAIFVGMFRRNVVPQEGSE